jgi:hypothetical protein
MRRLSALDSMVQNFQHNWETNPQFRALWSGGLGLTIIVVMCACMGFAFTFAGTAAAKLSGSSTPGTAFQPVANGTARSGSADNNVTFPTPTIPAWASPQIPTSALNPSSLTPAPTSTELPTPTPVPTNTNGNGGNPGGGNGGNGGGGKVTVNSATFVGGAPGVVVLTTSVPNANVNIFLVFPGNVSSPTNTGTTDSTGAGSITTTVVPKGCLGQVKVWIHTDISGDTTVYYPCTP